jgi:nitrogen fixation NifU-like protein
VTHDEAEVQDLYRELIIDHSRNPRHFGKLENATHTADGINPLCGDKLKIYVSVGTDGSIESTCFEGSGCAISVASASLMTETVTGLNVDTADNCCEEVTNRLTTGNNTELSGIDLEKLGALDGVRRFPSRVKCATLAWQALHAALHNESAPASTE